MQTGSFRLISRHRVHFFRPLQLRHGRPQSKSLNAYLLYDNIRVWVLMQFIYTSWRGNKGEVYTKWLLTIKVYFNVNSRSENLNKDRDDDY